MKNKNHKNESNNLKLMVYESVNYIERFKKGFCNVWNVPEEIVEYICDIVARMEENVKRFWRYDGNKSLIYGNYDETLDRVDWWIRQPIHRTDWLVRKAWPCVVPTNYKLDMTLLPKSARGDYIRYLQTKYKGYNVEYKTDHRKRPAYLKRLKRA